MTIDSNRTNLIQELNHNSVETLEFGKILEFLESYSSCEIGLELIQSLRPSFSTSEVKYFQEQTSEAREYLEFGGKFDASGIQDIRNIVKRARHGGQ